MRCASGKLWRSCPARTWRFWSIALVGQEVHALLPVVEAMVLDEHARQALRLVAAAVGL